ncbi:MAG: helix-hairpin-helix domain-containing protein [Candidatus Firestonebacteria bacterium]
MAKKLSIIFLIIFLSGVLAYIVVNAPCGIKVSAEEKAGRKIEKFCLVNINTAGEAELDTLPSIGPFAAKRIIEYRAQNGRFKTIDELKNVRGVGEKTFGKLKDRIRAE